MVRRRPFSIVELYIYLGTQCLSASIKSRLVRTFPQRRGRRSYMSHTYDILFKSYVRMVFLWYTSFIAAPPHPPQHTVLLIVHDYINSDKKNAAAPPLVWRWSTQAPLTDDSWALASRAGLFIGGCAWCDPMRQGWGAGTLIQLQGRTSESCSTFVPPAVVWHICRAHYSMGIMSEMLQHILGCVNWFRVRGVAAN